MTNNSNFFKLFTGYFGTRTIIQGIFPLLTVLAAKQGITTDKIGLFMTIIYVAILSGTMLSGRLSYMGIPLKWLMFGSSVAGGLGVAMMGYAHDFFRLTFSTSIVWFFSGIYQNSSTMLTAVLADRSEAGKRFGTLSDISLAGTIAGGVAVGHMIEALNYQSAFWLLGFLFAVPNLILLGIGEPKLARNTDDEKTGGFKLKPNFIWLLITTSLCLMLVHVSKFTLSLDMKDHKFDLCDISQAYAWGTFLCLPFPYLMGRWSDTGRKKPLLLCCFASIALGLGLLLVAAPYWTYIAGILFVNIMSYGSTPVILKMTNDDYPQEYVSQAQTWANSAGWGAAIVGYTWVGFAAHHLTVDGAQAIGIGVAFVSILLCVWKLE